jgi:hypothetical protein
MREQSGDESVSNACADSDLHLSCHLLQVENDEFCRFKGCKTDHNIDHAQVAVALGGGFGIALDEIGIAGFLSLKGTTPIEIVHKRPDIQANLRP